MQLEINTKLHIVREAKRTDEKNDKLGCENLSEGTMSYQGLDMQNSRNCHLPSFAFGTHALK